MYDDEALFASELSLAEIIDRSDTDQVQLLVWACDDYNTSTEEEKERRSVIRDRVLDAANVACVLFFDHKLPHHQKNQKLNYITYSYIMNSAYAAEKR